MSTSKIKKVLNLGLKLVILVASYLFIYYQLRNSPTRSLSWEGLRSLLSETPVIIALSGIFFMMIANWSLEALKWRYLVRKSEKVSFFIALKAVLAGITVSSFTPNRVGEYFGRVFILKNTNPWKGAFMTVVGSISQLVVTIVIGGVASVIFFYNYFPYEEYMPALVFWGLSLAVLLLVVIVLVLYFNVRLMEPILRRFTLKRWNSIRNQLFVFGEYSAKELAVVLALSVARYLVFALQYYFLLKLFMLPLGFWEGLMMIACIYFFMAAVPTIALSELGVRGSLAVFFLGTFFADNFLLADLSKFAAVSASTLIWIINLVIPALVGGIFVLQLKFFKK